VASFTEIPSLTKEISRHVK